MRYNVFSATVGVACLTLSGVMVACGSGKLSAKRDSCADIPNSSVDQDDEEEDASIPPYEDAGNEAADARESEAASDAAQRDALVADDAEAAADSGRLAAAVEGQWLLFDAPDNGGKNWSGSTLELMSLHADAGADKSAVEGRFVWRVSGVLRGEELVRGSFAAASSQLVLDGYMLINAQGIVRSHYNASYDPSKDELVGIWTIGVPGEWKARRTDPDGGPR